MVVLENIDCGDDDDDVDVEKKNILFGCDMDEFKFPLVHDEIDNVCIGEVDCLVGNSS